MTFLQCQTYKHVRHSRSWRPASDNKHDCPVRTGVCSRVAIANVRENNRVPPEEQLSQPGTPCQTKPLPSLIVWWRFHRKWTIIVRPFQQNARQLISPIMGHLHPIFLSSQSDIFVATKVDYKQFEAEDRVISACYNSCYNFLMCTTAALCSLTIIALKN